MSPEMRLVAKDSEKEVRTGLGPWAGALWRVVGGKG